MKLRIAVLCEFSGIVRDAFIALGHEAISCDLLPTDKPGPHIQGDCRDYDWGGYDIIVAHPPCFDLAVSGARWFKEKLEKDPECQNRALAFVQWIMDLPVKHIMIENPVSIISSRIRKPDCITHPYLHGHGEVKTTCLWLKGLPPLLPSNVVEGRSDRIHKCAPGKDRWKIRSTTYQGIAEAIAKQYSEYVINEKLKETEILDY